jgi:hypothetical protein
MKQVMITKAKARAFGRTCQCVRCNRSHVKCGQDIECVGLIDGQIVWLCHACGVNLERDGKDVAEILF